MKLFSKHTWPRHDGRTARDISWWELLILSWLMMLPIYGVCGLYIALAYVGCRGLPW